MTSFMWLLLWAFLSFTGVMLIDKESKINGKQFKSIGIGFVGVGLISLIICIVSIIAGGN